MTTYGRSYADGLTNGFVLGIKESYSKIPKLLELIISEPDLGEEGIALLMGGMLADYFHNDHNGLPEGDPFWMAREIISLINVSGGPFQSHKAEIGPALVYLSKRICEYLHRSTENGALAEYSMEVVCSMALEICEASSGSATRLMHLAGEKLVGLGAYKIFLNMKKDSSYDLDWLIEAFEGGRDQRDQKLSVEASESKVQDIESAKSALMVALNTCDTSDRKSVANCKMLADRLTRLCSGDSTTARKLIDEIKPNLLGGLTQYCDKPVSGERVE